MTDRIDEMFENDLSKLSMPSELAMNAAKVKAAQTDKPGAEKPDLYAKGKGVGKGGKPAKDEENDERKSKGPNKGEKKDPNAPDKQQGAKSKDDMDKEAEDDERAYTATRYYKKRFLLPGMKETRRTIAIRGKIPAQAPVPTPETDMQKKSNLDDEFNADMRQIVGVEAMDKEANWERPDVSVEGQTTDRIDDHFIGWMKDKADEDVVKEASTKSEMAVDTLKRMPTSEGAKKLKKMLMGSGAKGALAATAVTAPVAAGLAYKAGKKKGEKTAEIDKEAGVQQNPENLDLLARIRKSAEEKVGLGLLAGTGDV